RRIAMSIRTSMLGRMAVAVCAFAFAAPAGAADLRMPVKAPIAPPAVFSWAGCDFRGYGGGALAACGAGFPQLGNTAFNAFSGGVTAPRVEGQHSWGVPLDSSFIAGGTLGCNWQPAGSPFVVGVEGEGGFMRLTGSRFDPLINPTLTVAAFRGT